jgi:hypothetical protein
MPTRKWHELVPRSFCDNAQALPLPAAAPELDPALPALVGEPELDPPLLALDGEAELDPERDPELDPELEADPEPEPLPGGALAPLPLPPIPPEFPPPNPASDDVAVPFALSPHAAVRTMKARASADRWMAMGTRVGGNLRDILGGCMKSKAS